VQTSFFEQILGTVLEFLFVNFVNFPFGKSVAQIICSGQCLLEQMLFESRGTPTFVTPKFGANTCPPECRAAQGVFNP
jgi:hypothetical protein